ncbi:hypothetical protein IHN63_00310 [Deinococcus sp. 6YEL10]|uniref:hypothetical protein n=1 Tax=Deinococcus sp. 6YEL10 TaxID=2745870 RepID=UPI001E58491D|nr:hypothetical protein [Deinococcus sp. 6YEL10]MCD0159741.1 hypothetical protein [Deinococcus sp. 6YEL10]
MAGITKKNKKKAPAIRNGQWNKLIFRMTSDERDKLDRMSDAQGVTLSAVLRRLINEAPEPQ